MPPTHSIESSLHPPSSGSTNNQSTDTHSLVTHIRDLLPLPKHATFHVRLVIHQLYNVPFVSGDFRIKWKFTHLQAVNSDGRPIGFGRALALKLDTNKKKHSGENVTKQNAVDSKGKGKERMDSSGTTLAKDEEDDNSYHGLTNSPTIETASFDSPERQRPASETPQSQQSVSTKSDSTRSDSTGIHFHTETRGYTPYHPLKNFKVHFETEVNAAVQMNVERNTRILLPSELKLTMCQHVIPGDPAAPPNARLGHVIINLAEYANVGSVTRNYLLRRSKVNALLKLTLTVTHIAGEENYKAPPLRKEEIKAGFADYLNGADCHIPIFEAQEPLDDPWLAATIHQITPPVLPLEDESVTPFPSESQPLQPDLRAKKGWRKTKTAESPRPPPKPLKPRPKKSPTPTEVLIEAIFNPYPSTSDDPSPFTYYVPHMPPHALLDSTPSDTTSTHASMESSQQGHDSMQTGITNLTDAGSRSTNSSVESSTPSGSKWWKRRQTSRPVTPASGRI